MPQTAQFGTHNLFVSLGESDARAIKLDSYWICNDVTAGDFSLWNLNSKAKPKSGVNLAPIRVVHHHIIGYTHTCLLLTGRYVQISWRQGIIWRTAGP